MNRLNKIETVFFILTAIGGLNWGLIGLFDFNLVSELFSSTDLQKVIYSLVGFATVGLTISLLTRNDHFEA